MGKILPICKKYIPWNTRVRQCIRAYPSIFMAISKTRPQPKEKPPLIEDDKVTLSLTMSKMQFNSLVAMRKKKGMLSDQELVRLFISNGLEGNG